MSRVSARFGTKSRAKEIGAQHARKNKWGTWFGRQYGRAVKRARS